MRDGASTYVLEVGRGSQSTWNGAPVEGPVFHPTGSGVLDLGDRGKLSVTGGAADRRLDVVIHP